MGRPFDIAEKQSFSGSMCSAARVMFFAAAALSANYIIIQMKRARTFVRALWLFSLFLLNFLYRHNACAIFALHLKKGCRTEDLIQKIQRIEGVVSVEEI